jgi:hypothetical protein
MENNKLTIEQRRQAADDLIKAAEQGDDVRNADPRVSSMEAVVLANRIRRAGGKAIEFTL